LNIVENGASARCVGCSGAALPFDITFAFQPIVDLRNGRIESYEALVRGPQGQSAASILAGVDESSQYRFDQTCRVTAITLAARLGMKTNLNLNFLPNAVYRPEVCIQTTLAAARAVDFPIDRIVFEVIESERVDDPNHLRNILSEYKRLGFTTAIDDFGAGYAGLGFLADFQPDIIKLDMKLIRDVDHDAPRQAIVRAIIGLCRELNIRTVAEGVETFAEYVWLAEAGADLFQGYLFAKPGVEALPSVDFARFRLAPPAVRYRVVSLRQRTHARVRADASANSAAST
jgi:EAL domain-containing protein (putative c-di-GMP-specific phosphodiesterase class I)